MKIAILLTGLILLSMMPMVSAKPNADGPIICIPLPLDPITVGEIEDWVSCELSGGWRNCGLGNIMNLINDKDYVICIVTHILEI